MSPNNGVSVAQLLSVLSVPLDLGALKDNPMVKAGLEKAAEVMKHPQVQAILQSEAFKTQMKPENLKKVIKSYILTIGLLIDTW